jgi:hypothetical protein
MILSFYPTIESATLDQGGCQCIHRRTEASDLLLAARFRNGPDWQTELSRYQSLSTPSIPRILRFGPS